MFFSVSWRYWGYFRKITFWILSEDYLLKFTVQAVPKAVLFFPGKQDPDQGALRHECKAEFPAEHIGIFKCIVFQMVDPADDRSDCFLLHRFRKGVDILVVGVECRFIDACKRAQFFYCDLFQRFRCSQFDKSVPYRLFCFLNPQIHDPLQTDKRRNSARRWISDILWISSVDIRRTVR